MLFVLVCCGGGLVMPGVGWASVGDSAGEGELETETGTLAWSGK